MVVFEQVVVYMSKACSVSVQPWGTCMMMYWVLDCRRTVTLVEELSVPPPGSEPLHFANRYSRTLPQQFAICLWRNRQAYWCVGRA